MAQVAGTADQDKISPADADRVARDSERRELVVALAVLNDRKDAIVGLIEDKKTRLSVLLQEDKLSGCSEPEGRCGWEDDWQCKIIDPDKLGAKVPPGVLAEFVRPTRAFVEAMKTARLDISDCIKEGRTAPSFAFHRPQTREAKEARDRGIEQTKREASDAVARLVARLLASKTGAPT